MKDKFAERVEEFSVLLKVFAQKSRHSSDKLNLRLRCNMDVCSYRPCQCCNPRDVELTQSLKSDHVKLIDIHQRQGSPRRSVLQTSCRNRVQLACGMKRNSGMSSSKKPPIPVSPMSSLDSSSLEILTDASVQDIQAVRISRAPHEPWQESVLKSCTPVQGNSNLILITGAAGFIGTHVALALKRRGDGVVGLDCFNPYYDPSLKRAREAILKKEGIHVIEGDINDAQLLDKLFKFIPFTHVMHLAAQAGVRYALENPLSYVHSNIAGLVTLAEACVKAAPQPALVWASSSSVYGLNNKVPFSESDRTDQPASLYAATKKAGEALLHTYNHIYGLSVTGLRFFTVYGPWGRPDMAYFSFTRDILQGNPITIYQGPDDSDLARDFTYIDDVVKGCVASLDTAEPSAGTGGNKTKLAQLRVFNLGNTSPVTVPAMVETLEILLGKEAKKTFIRMPQNGDVPFTHADVSLAKAELGYNPTTDLQTGLKNFVEWYLDFYKNNI